MPKPGGSGSKKEALGTAEEDERNGSSPKNKAFFKEINDSMILGSMFVVKWSVCLSSTPTILFRRSQFFVKFALENRENK